MAVQVDLGQLSRPQTEPNKTGPRHRHRLVWFTRYLLPAVLIVGFLGTLAYSLRAALFPGKPVHVVPVLAVRSQIERPQSELFQCAGWVEPRPTPVVVSALEEGVVDELLVIEGQELQPGDVVARLIDEDAKLKLRAAEAEADSRRAELTSREATLAAAEANLREPLSLKTKIAEAEAMLARIENDLSRLPSQVKAAQSRAALAATEKQSRSQSTDVVGKLSLARAENEYQAATAALAELEAQRLALEKEANAHKRLCSSLHRQLELKIEEHRQHAEAVAAVELAKAQLELANVEVETAKLALNRMTIRATRQGKVLALVARPGSRVMGLAPASMPDASTIITMYDPAQLQIRADVRLEDVPRVVPGQSVRIETPAVEGTLTGQVIAATSLTDIQKNTLQVKIGVQEPPAVLKPDMLVQVTFIAPAEVAARSGSADRALSLVIPPELIQRNGEQNAVWIADRQHGVARMQPITLGGLTPNGMREVTSGLAAGDRLIVRGSESLRGGDRIRIIGELAEKDLRNE